MPNNTPVYHPIFLDKNTGFHKSLPNNAIINIGGTSSSTFTVGGKELLFSDGTATGGSTSSIIGLQPAYENSGTPATIDMIEGLDLIITVPSLDSGISAFKIDSLSAEITIGGNLTVGGSINEVDIVDLYDALQDHVNLPESDKHIANEISIDSESFEDIEDEDFRNVQGVLNFLNVSINSIDDQVQELQSDVDNLQSQIDDISREQIVKPVGQSFPFLTPSINWNINHQKNTRNVVFSIFDADGFFIQPDSIQIQDENTILVIFSTVQSGKINIIFYNDN
jgi:hypothetical protein